MCFILRQRCELLSDCIFEILKTASSKTVSLILAVVNCFQIVSLKY